MSVLVGKKAPDFDVKAVINGGEVTASFKLSDLKGKYVMLFFYPFDFTFVCPTELHAFQENLVEFERRNVQLIGCSVDSEYSHSSWLNTPRSKGGIQGITYPIVSDIHKTISRDYDVLNEEIGASYRGLFLIDQEGIVRHQLVNDLPIGRSIEEALRVVDALQFVEKNGEVCPANWREGDRALKETPDSVISYFNG